MGKASMREVAELAGVSIATVSHVINNTRFVSEKTRQCVLDSIHKLDYRPDQMARIFKTGHKYLIGFIVPDIANIFFARIIEEIESAIGHEGYRLIVSNTRETQASEIENIRMLANGIVDGLIIASTMDSYNQIAGLIPTELPRIFIDRALPNCPYDTITIANYRAMYTAVETLINTGHHRIGYITGLPRLSTTKERFAAYKDAMGVYSLPVEDGFVYMGNSMRKGAEMYVEPIVNMGCTALIVSNNIMTDDVLFYLNDHSLKNKIALVGYNDSDYHSYEKQHFYNICQPAAELGRMAGMQIMERIANPGLQPRHVVLQATFAFPT